MSTTVKSGILLIGLSGVACNGSSDIGGPEAQSELLIAYVEHESLPVETLHLLLASGAWSSVVHGVDFERHPQNAQSSSSGFIRIPGDDTLVVQVAFMVGDTIASADLRFATEPGHGYRFSFYPTRDRPGYGGDAGIPFKRKPQGFPSDSVFYRWSGSRIEPLSSARSGILDASGYARAVESSGGAR